MSPVDKRQNQLRKICQSLKAADADVVDIIQFGSSVYAPDLARDVNLLITTRNKKDEDLYLDAFLELEIGVDVIVRTPGQVMGKDIAASVFLLGKVLLGNGQTMKEAKGFMAAPTFERARTSLKTADTNLSHAQRCKRVMLKDEYYKVAFNRLFGAVFSSDHPCRICHQPWRQMRTFGNGPCRFSKEEEIFTFEYAAKIVCGIQRGSYHPGSHSRVKISLMVNASRITKKRMPVATKAHVRRLL